MKARLSRVVSIELTRIAQRLKQQFGNEDTAMVGVAMQPLREAMTSNVRPALMILLVHPLFFC